MKTEAVRPYYDILSGKKGTLAAKRAFDLVMAALLLIFLSPVMLVIAVAVKLDSKGEIFFRQERVTQYGKIFKIYKFRTMVKDADKLGSQVTTQNDARVTRTGRFLRKYRLDETAQLINVLLGDMSFVGTRPEIRKNVHGRNVRDAPAACWDNVGSQHYVQGRGKIACGSGVG